MATEAIEESVLIERARMGDQDAFAALVERHARPAYNVAYRVMGNAAEAEDITQEAFVRAHRALGRFRPGAPFAPWLYKIVTNLALNALEKQRLPTRSLDDLPPLVEPSARGADEPPARALAAERQAALRAALLALSPAQRAVVELRHFQGQSYEAIAQTLGIPLSDVKSRLFRARQKLKEHLREWLTELS